MLAIPLPTPRSFRVATALQTGLAALLLALASPLAGAQEETAPATAAGSAVTLAESGCPAGQTEIPNLAGLTFSEAQTLLGEWGGEFVLAIDTGNCTFEEPDPGENGIIRRNSPCSMPGTCKQDGTIIGVILLTGFEAVNLTLVLGLAALAGALAGGIVAAIVLSGAAPRRAPG